MHENHGDRVTFIGVAGRDDLSPITDFIETFGVGAFEHAVDDDGAIWAEYSITTQPAFVFMNDDGTATTHVGPLGVDGLTAAVAELTS